MDRCLPRSRRLAACLVVIAIGVVTHSGLAAEGGDPGVITLATDVRSGPAVRDAVVATVPAGHPVTVIELRGPSARIQSASGVSGWVPTSKVRLGAVAAGTAPPGAPPGSGLLRGLSGLFGGGGGSGAKVTVGLRGLNGRDIASARPSAAALREVDAYRVGRADAERFGRASGLVSRRIDHLAPAPAAPAGGRPARSPSPSGGAGRD